jgi:hypothetical protein
MLIHHQYLIQVAAIDLDDTLLRSDGVISLQSLDSIRRWQARGKQVVIATGRPRRSARHVLPAEFRELPLVCYNGAEIHINGETIYQNLISPAAVQQILAVVQEATPDCTVGLEVGGELYLNRKMERPSPYHVADLQVVAQHPAAKVILFAEMSPPLQPVIDVLPSEVRALLSPKYRVVQLLAHTADKAEALGVLLAQWGISWQQVAAFGDDVNDVEMVRSSGFGVAMSNAIDEVKAVATYHTSSNDEDGVAVVLEQLMVCG